MSSGQDKSFKGPPPRDWRQRVPPGGDLSTHCGHCGQPLTEIADEMRCLTCEPLSGEQLAIFESEQRAS